VADAPVAGADLGRHERLTTVVHLITTLTQGGAERVLSQVVPRPDEHPSERHVVVSLVPGGMFADELAVAGVDVRDLGMRPGRDVVRGTLRLARLLDELRPELVVSWMYHASLLDLLARPLARRGRRARMVWMLRGSLEAIALQPWHTRVVLRLLARASRRPDAIATNSLAGRDQHAAAGLRPRRWIHLANGCDTARFFPDPATRAEARSALTIADDELTLLFLGRDHPEKGLDLLLDALTRIDGAGPRPVLLLVGSGTEHTVAPQDARCRTIALGERNDVDRLLQAADALVLPSRTEGTSNALIEAMATGLVCVVTDVGDSAALVGEDGIVVPPGSATHLAAGIGTLRSLDAQERARRGAAVRARVAQEHDLDRARARYRAFWTGADR
jgi:glycosyltransferase involved in cell wall biosynthesis